MSSIKCQKYIPPEYIEEKITTEGETIFLCENCPFVELDQRCTTCFGQVAVLKDKPNKLYRNYFDSVNGKIIEKNNFDKFIKKAGVFVYYNTLKKHTWVYTDRPTNYKVACIVCKQRYKEKDKIPPCQKEKHTCKKQKSRILYMR